ncbi:MAG: MoxR family ATPase, partial [Betaproteobacteria bacterium]|nr:MoxR family ATPase [Betaproteobacteria bacterium]
MAGFGRHDYICDRRLATVAFLSLRMKRPLLLEGEAGVGKTELAKTLAAMLQAPLIRLQCYEGLDIAQAAYEWNVSRQLLEIRLAEASGTVDASRTARDLYRREMLIERPLLQALLSPVPAVLLIDELDRADEPFEAFLLEMLGESQITIPELGTLKAAHPPHVVITSNRTRELRDALKRRCLYHWLDYPDAEREFEIVQRRVPQAAEALGRQAVEFVQRVRTMGL